MAQSQIIFIKENQSSKALETCITVDSLTSSIVNIGRHVLDGGKEHSICELDWSDWRAIFRGNHSTSMCVIELCLCWM